jgi:hypothetical protein
VINSSVKETKLYQHGKEYFVKRQAGKGFTNMAIITGLPMVRKFLVFIFYQLIAHTAHKENSCCITAAGVYNCCFCTLPIAHYLTRLPLLSSFAMAYY